MKQITSYIKEGLKINSKTKVNSKRFGSKDIEDLTSYSKQMFKAYSGSYGWEELYKWANEEEPTEDDYKEFIDDIIAWCKENNKKISPNFKYTLEDFDKLSEEDQNEIKIAIFRGMDEMLGENT